jgi:hypothetical protein
MCVYVVVMVVVVVAGVHSPASVTQSENQRRTPTPVNPLLSAVTASATLPVLKPTVPPAHVLTPRRVERRCVKK